MLLNKKRKRKTCDFICVSNMPGKGSLYRFQSGRGLRSRFEQQAEDLMLEGAKESLRGIDVNQLIK